MNIYKILCLLKWYKIQSILLYVFSLKLFIFSFVLFVFSLILFILSHILYIFSLIFFTFSHILYIFSLILFVFSHILYIYSGSTWMYSVTSYIYSVSPGFSQSSCLYSVSHTVREVIVPQILLRGRFRNNQIELRIEIWKTLQESVYPNGHSFFWRNENWK